MVSVAVSLERFVGSLRLGAERDRELADVLADTARALAGVLDDDDATGAAKVSAARALDEILVRLGGLGEPADRGDRLDELARRRAVRSEPAGAAAR